jgi:RNA polymerase sigma-70 factor (ECF subfamily)
MVKVEISPSIEQVADTDTSTPNMLKYEKMYRLHYNQLLGHARNFKIPDHEGLVQDVLLKAFLNLDKYSEIEGSEFASWIHKILHNAALDEYRKKKRQNTIPYEYINNYADEPDSRAEDAFAGPEMKEIMDRVEKTLSAEMLGIFVMHTFEKASYEEIGREHGIKLGTVKSRIHRAHKKLKSDHELMVMLGVQNDISEDGEQ